MISSSCKHFLFVRRELNRGEVRLPLPKPMAKSHFFKAKKSREKIFEREDSRLVFPPGTRALNRSANPINPTGYAHRGRPEKRGEKIQNRALSGFAQITARAMTL
jgi:hypothetical protein